MAKGDKPRASRVALGDERRLTAGCVQHGAPAWSRDGRSLLISVGDARDASWVLIDRRGRVARTFEGPAIGRASFARDGSIAFSRRVGPSSEIWLTPGAETPPVRLLGGDGRSYRDPAFSPDGSTLACAVGDPSGGGSQLMLLRVADGHRVALTDMSSSGGRADSHPDFVPIDAAGTSNELVFEGTVGDDRGIYVLSLRTGEVARLTPMGERACRPTAIDATRLCYERRPDNGPAVLVLLDRERARAQVLSEDANHRCQPACFASAGKKIKLAYAAQAPTEREARKGQPPRLDIYIAKLRGLEAAATTTATEGTGTQG